MADKTVSLNEDLRRKETKENKDRQNARKDEIRKRPEPTYKYYDLTLKDTELPGLPPPTSKTNTVAKAEEKAANIGSLEGDDKAEEEEVSPIDVHLVEGERILLDLIALSANKPSVAELVQHVR